MTLSLTIPELTQPLVDPLDNTGWAAMTLTTRKFAIHPIISLPLALFSTRLCL